MRDYFSECGLNSLPLLAGQPMRTVHILNKHQRSVLEAIFKVQISPNKTTLKELAIQIGLSERQIYQWFVQARRTYEKRQEKCESNLVLSEFIS